MGQAAEILSTTPERYGATGTPLKVVPKEIALESTGITKEIVTLGLLLALLQLIDGMLTILGIGRFGIEAEGNPILRNSMFILGPVATLAFSKCVACGFIACLCWWSSKVCWISAALKGLICVYSLAAVVPWIYILFSS